MPGEFGKEPPIGAASTRGSSGLRSYSPVQLFFIQRLSHLIKQRRENVNLIPATDWKIRLLNKALYSTYRDCVELGLGEEARQLLERQQEAN